MPLLNELRFGFRALARQPTPSLMALITLVVGIGANTAIFSVVKGVLLNSLPYTKPEELAVLGERKPEGGIDLVSPPTYLDWREQARSFPEMAAYRPARYSFLAKTEPINLSAIRAVPEVFPLLGAEAFLGRTFTLDEEASAAIASWC